MRRPDTQILTAASAAFGPSLLALLGSLNLNWPGHPPVLVYDIGLDEPTRATLRQQNVEVRQVPAFCPHWHRHFTWKIWAWNDAPAQQILWLDAGIIVLRPLDDVLQTIREHGYFFLPNGCTLDGESPQTTCHACQVTPEFRMGKPTVAGGFIGFRKDGAVAGLLRSALTIALTEENIAATAPGHRHDQAILSLLAHRDLAPLLLADKAHYLADKSPRQFAGQPVWIHRRTLHYADGRYLAGHISRAGKPFVPRMQPWWAPFLPWRLWRQWRAPADDQTVYNGVRD